MKVLIHTDEYYPTCAACAYRMKVFAETFVEQGNEVVVIASSTNVKDAKIEIQKEKIIYVPTIRMKKKTTIMRLINNISFAISSFFAAFKVGKVDAVITTSPPPLVSISGWLIAKVKRAKLVYDVRDIWPDVALEMNSFTEASIYAKVFRVITDFMYRHADLITTVSSGKVKKLKGKLKEEEQDKVILVGNGFDEQVLNNELDHGIIEQYNLEEKFTCVYIGNIGLAQGLETLLDLAAQVDKEKIQFLLFGTGAEREKLEKRAIEEGLTNVRFCGVLPHEKVISVLNKAGLSFIPLKNSNMKDSVPTKIYEALGVGCPILLVAEGDACEIVEEAKLGRSISPNNVEDVKKVFEELIENYDEIKMNEEFAKYLMCSKYSRQKIALSFEKELRKLVGIAED